MMKNRFNIYGSKDSLDLNTMIYVDSIPDRETAIKMCEEFEEELSITFSVLQYPKKNVKVNLGVIDFGKLVDVLYGFPEEIHNALHETYKYHYHGKNKQAYLLPIKEKVKFSIGKKISHSIESILDHLKESNFEQDIIKLDDIKSKIIFLRNLNLNQEIEFNTEQSLFKFNYKDDPYKELLNCIAVKCGQIILMNSNMGSEIYTKGEISENLPELKQFMDRYEGNLDELNSIKNEFIDICVEYYKL